MARGAREKPRRLAEKLLHIRTSLGISQSEMLKRLGAEDRMDYYRISEFESGKGEPSLPVLLQYARVAGVSMESLADVPDNLPSKVKHSHR
jgi:transcriptional regulator with XRE-family HTH domain